MSKVTMLDDLDLRQLEAFSAVISSGSITSAAKILHRSQPAVTRLIQEFENKIGYPLFQRNGPRITATEQAYQLHESVEHALISLHQVQVRAKEIAEDEEKPLVIAATPAMAAGLLPMALSKVDISMPLQILSYSAEQTLHAVIDGRADIAISSLPLEHKNVNRHWIGQSRCVVVLNEDDPLAQETIITLQALVSRKIITLYNPYRLRNRFELAMKKAKIQPRYTIETNSSANMLACVRAGLGVAITEPVTAYGLPLHGLIIRELDIDIPYHFGVITPLAKTSRTSVLQIVDALENTARELLPHFTLFHSDDHHKIMLSLNA
ncbi:LysR family transcriptional regulator [Pectobacterium polonicum]|uniref:LysR family transcriptional regulator n=1 Tax=Pectobacterium polonicum TaxID=2485124 RepID=A0AAE9SYP9_9GAMM|nr:LysR family transcriptional regulator [Pectobacterium polonicum]MDC9818557.1 LysR family transcriptional regulator [Pectobacterium polonicum]UVO07011.1 LysR family transcriptional regulator [Pectobacterium polonicum]GKW23718.1 LysR family transcriptional regulator [Pectobacterium carotovorum subsp. carotovorum]